MSTITISDWTKLGAAIRDARTRHGLTQSELASSAKVSRSWLAKVESGHRGAELEQILRLLSALGLGLFLQAPSERGEPLAASNTNTWDDIGSLNTRTRARDSQTRTEASRALLAAHREAASRRRGSWHVAQEATENSPFSTESRDFAGVGSA